MQQHPFEAALASAPAPAVNTAPQPNWALHQEKKGPRLWLWIPLAIVGGLILLVGLALGLLATHHYPTVGEAAQAAGQYYQAIEQHDYTTAYTYLERNARITIQGHPVGIDSVNTLTTASQTLDTQEGVITSASFADGNFEQGNTVVDLTMQVTRNGKPYAVHLKIELVGNDWKILSADGI